MVEEFSVTWGNNLRKGKSQTVYGTFSGRRDGTAGNGHWLINDELKNIKVDATGDRVSFYQQLHQQGGIHPLDVEVITFNPIRKETK